MPSHFYKTDSEVQAILDSGQIQKIIPEETTEDLHLFATIEWARNLPNKELIKAIKIPLSRATIPGSSLHMALREIIHRLEKRPNHIRKF